MRSIALACALLAAAPASAAQIVVDPGGGGDFLDLQEGIDAASPGDVVLVTGGCYRGIVVDKPLSIVGSATILRTSASCASPFLGSGIGDPCDGTACPALEIQLPGAGGVVALAGITIDGRWNAGLFDYNAEATIRCSSNTDLRMFDCTVKGPTGFQATGLSVITTAAIQGVGASVTLVRTSVTGGEHVCDTDDFDFWEFLAQKDGPPAIVAKEVMLQDSSVVGGTQGDFAVFELHGDCPPSWPVGPNPTWGSGGAGIVADRVIMAGGSLAGGKGSTISAFCSGVPGFVYTQQPTGVACDCGTFLTLANDLISSGKARLGQPWSVAATGSGGALVLGSVHPDPIPVGPPGALFLTGPAVFVLPTNALAATIPSAPQFAGVEFAFQWLSPAGTLSRPVFETIQP